MSMKKSCLAILLTLLMVPAFLPGQQQTDEQKKKQAQKQKNAAQLKTTTAPAAGTKAAPERKPPAPTPAPATTGRNTARMPAPPPTKSYSDPKTGRQWEVNNRGQIATIRDQRTGVTINHGIGENRIVTVRPDNTRIVSVGARVGYVERPLAARPGFVSRTYVVNGVSFARVYQTQVYQGVTVYRYVPAYYYAPAYYGWAMNPWAAPVRYNWGWYGNPWYGFYGGYFAPAPYYPNASLWLTDYLIAQNMQLAYQNQMLQNQQYGGAPAGNGYGAAVPLSPEVKQAVADEVSRQIAGQQAAAAAAQNPGQQPPPQYAENTPPPALDPNQRIFVVSSNLNVMTPDGQTCGLTPADMILRLDTTIQDGDQVNVSVMSSKPGDCPVNTSTQLQVSALQEMHNQFCEQISAGLKTLGDSQGKGGIPAGPAAMQSASTNGQAPADANAAAQLQAQQQYAQQLEADARKATPPPNNQ
jgi:hypothetical protein